MHFDQSLFNQNVHSTVYPNAPAGVEFPGDPGFNTNNRPSNTKLNDFAPRARRRLGSQRRWPHDHPRFMGNVLRDAAHPVRLRILPGSAMGRIDQPAPMCSSAIPGARARTAAPPFPAAIRSRSISNKNFVFPIPGNYTTYPLDLQPTYLEQWNLSLQKQIGANWLLSASYLGNNTVHLWADAPINAPVFIPGNCAAGQYGLTAAGACSTTANQNFRRPLYLQNPAQGQYFGTIHQLDTGSTASYNALLLSAQHRLSSHFTVLGNYTWSHCIAGAFTSELDGTQYTNPANRNFDRGNCVGIDHRTLINVSAVEEAPKFSQRWMQLVAGDWKLSEIMRIQSGSFFSVTTATDQALNSIGGQRASLDRGAARIPRSRLCRQWLNPAAFANPRSAPSAWVRPTSWDREPSTST